MKRFTATIWFIILWYVDMMLQYLCNNTKHAINLFCWSFIFVHDLLCGARHIAILPFLQTVHTPSIHMIVQANLHDYFYGAIQVDLCLFILSKHSEIPWEKILLCQRLATWKFLATDWSFASIFDSQVTMVQADHWPRSYQHLWSGCRL